ncbi:TetR/AcrR family transcriptional regulator [Planomonospora sp. ID67723]|uniref:TetR/AcrR family transcriptional regulator n=1 Tax=Planomonospora sp. ID67723 TaxID=2738134 RepID=UPI001A2AF13C|nr:TetR/AcrR family transcriptional regulator [Planomonospora sp. ID67723]MBG0831830.1 TetR/AcrR family transcriptional regulator [Planomonospora sp. ID67723]
MTTAGPGPLANRSSPASTAKGDNRRQNLLDVTEHILVTRGNAELSLRAVATAAGVRLGHLQHYFPTRGELIHAVLNRVLERSLRQVADLMGPQDAIGVRSHEPVQLIQVLLTQQQDDRLVRLFTEVWALAAHDASAAGAVRAFYRDYVGHVAAFVQQRDPVLTPQVCQARAETFVMLIEGAALFRSGIASSVSAGTDAELLTTAAALLGSGPPGSE